MFVLNGDVMALSESNSQVSVRQIRSRSNSLNISSSSSTLLVSEATLWVAAFSWILSLLDLFGVGSEEILVDGYEEVGGIGEMVGSRVKGLGYDCVRANGVSDGGW